MNKLPDKNTEQEIATISFITHLIEQTKSNAHILLLRPQTQPICKLTRLKILHAPAFSIGFTHRRQSFTEIELSKENDMMPPDTRFLRFTEQQMCVYTGIVRIENITQLSPIKCSVFGMFKGIAAIWHV